MILIDSNIFMYAAGAPHPHKAPSAALLQRVAKGEVSACVDAEALQEILHRYRAIGRWEDGARLYDLARRLFPTVHPITQEIMDEARQLLSRYGHLMARDAVHAAACVTLGAQAICSYDADFDRVAEVARIEPAV